MTKKSKATKTPPKAQDPKPPIDKDDDTGTISVSAEDVKNAAVILGVSGADTETENDTTGDVAVKVGTTKVTSIQLTGKLNGVLKVDESANDDICVNVVYSEEHLGVIRNDFECPDLPDAISAVIAAVKSSIRDGLRIYTDLFLQSKLRR